MVQAWLAVYNSTIGTWGTEVATNVPKERWVRQVASVASTPDSAKPDADYNRD